MQKTNSKVNPDESIPFTDLIRSNFRQIYDRYFFTQINIKEDEAPKEMKYQIY